MTYRMILVALCAAAVLGASAQRREKTSFQTSTFWRPTIDVHSDVVMVYGTGGRPDRTFHDRVQSWRDKGYTVHFMTGIAWGQPYSKYFEGEWDGKVHLDERQVLQSGKTMMNGGGPNNPYIVPTLNYVEYIKECQIRPVIDEGIDAIYLEEPEFWAKSGYSEAFKREWQDYYGFPWRPQHESAENTYLSNKLKYHLYYRAIDEAFSYAKQYGKEKHMNVRCYVATHTLLNYAGWGIVSPEASLASLKSCDGYIAQVWTGTARTHCDFNGITRERVFERAFLEYGCMESMTRPTGRKVFFLTDPIEDARVDWDDYKRNYQATFTAQLLYPQVADYEVMPWPKRIFEDLYKINGQSEEKIRIPRHYSTQILVMINALNEMPLSYDKVSGSQGISVLMANSLMFQRSLPSAPDYSDPRLSGFFGLSMPLLKRGVPVSISHIENLGYPDSWKDTKLLLMTYFNMKPLDPAAHRHIAEWVKKGGCLIYCGRDDDPYQSVLEWWNQNGNNYSAPSQHLFAQMGMPLNAPDGVYRYGKGRVCVIRQNPKDFVLNAGGDALLLQRVEELYGPIERKNSLLLHRGPYVVAAAMDEGAVSDEPLVLRGTYIDLFDPSLPIMKTKRVQPGEQTLLYDLSKVRRKSRPQVLAAASRQYDEKVGRHSFSFTSKSPINTSNVMRILLPRQPRRVDLGIESRSQWDEDSHTLLLEFENSPEGVHVEIAW